MNKLCIIALKSLFLSIITYSTFLYIFSYFINDGNIVGLINGFSIISVLFFCTFLIIDEIKKNNNQK